MKIRQLTPEQQRQLVDLREAFESFEALRNTHATRYRGSMRWVERGNAQYLLRKVGRSEVSLGPRSAVTERLSEEFHSGRDATRQNLEGAAATIDSRARVARALALGRVPGIAARVMRKLSEQGLLGRQVHVVGTHALFAYEASAGVQFESALLTTGDADLILDPRRRLKLSFAGIRHEGVLALLQRVDSTFRLDSRGYRAVSRNGFYIDLIRPQSADPLADRSSGRLGPPGDLEAVPIAGLAWLESAPRFSAVAVDDRGYPVRIHTVDPRAFALHKLWVAERSDRDPVKKQRDRLQGLAVADLAVEYLGLSFNAPELSALPARLFARLPPHLREKVELSRPSPGAGDEIPEPDW